MPHATTRRSLRRWAALVPAAALALVSCSHDGADTKPAHAGIPPGPVKIRPVPAVEETGARRATGGPTIGFSVPGRPVVRVRERLIDGVRYASAIDLLGALGLEVEFRPARGVLTTRVGSRPLRIVAGRPAIEYGGRTYHTRTTARAAGDDLLLPEEFLGPLRAAFLEAGDQHARATASSPEGSALGSVVIDPGHGGDNTGAKGPGGILEKNLTLQVAKRLARMLREEIGCRVVLTRETDHALSLPERTAIANRERADLFVSIHANASPSRGASGYETFVLSATATDAESKRIADEENAAGSEGAGAAAAGFLDRMLQDLARAESMEESARFASLVQRFMDGAIDSENRGVKQAPFWVLAGAEMPAVLVEIGFITNPSEAARLESPATQERIARSLASAVSAFRAELDRRRGLAALAAP